MNWNLRLSSFPASQILFALLVWSLLILRFGYRFGTGDQVEVLPYTLLLHDASLYSNDFVLQALHATIPNERTVIAYLLLPFVNHLELTCLILHCLVSVFLILGLMKIAGMFIGNKYLAWFTVPVSLIVFNDYALGNLELFTDCLQASQIAVAIIAWALVFFLQRKYTTSILLMSIASVMHGLEGLDVMMVLGVILLIAVLRKEITPIRFVILSMLYLSIAGVYLMALFIAKQGTANISNEQLFEILFRFRHPHHFIFLLFPKFKMLVFFLLSGIALIYFQKRSGTLCQFMFIGLLAIGLYAVAVDGFQNVFIGNFQMYRITTWMKFFGLVAALAWMEKYIQNISIPPKLAVIDAPLFFAGFISCWILIVNFHQYLPYQVPFELFQLKDGNEMISICKEIKANTAKDAIFIQPFDNSELKFYAERSSYVEFKANVHDKKYVAEWYRRIQSVYGLSLENSYKGFQLNKTADEHFQSLDSLELKQLQKEGVTHMLIKKGYNPPYGNLILSNHSYAVYQL